MINQWVPVSNTGSYWRFGESGARLNRAVGFDGWYAHVPRVGSVYRDTLKDAALWVQEKVNGR